MLVTASALTQRFSPPKRQPVTPQARFANAFPSGTSGRQTSTPMDINPVEQYSIRKFIPLAQKLDGAYVHSPYSLTNQLYGKLYPRERGVIIYGGSFRGDAGVYKEKAREFAQALVKAGFHVVTGGGPQIMEELAKGAVEAGGHATGCQVNYFVNTYGPPSPAHKELIMHERYDSRIGGTGGYESRGAFTMVFPGGIGTYGELFQKLNELAYDLSPKPSQKAIILVDINGFYSGPNRLLAHLGELAKEGWVKADHLKMIKVARTPEEALNVLQDKAIPWTPGLPDYREPRYMPFYGQMPIS